MEKRKGSYLLRVYRNGTNKKQSSDTTNISAHARFSDFCLFSFTINLKRGTSHQQPPNVTTALVNRKPAGADEKVRAVVATLQRRGCGRERAALNALCAEKRPSPQPPRRSCTPAAAPCTSPQAHLQCMRRALGCRQKCANDPKQGQHGVKAPKGDSEGFQKVPV